MSVGGLKLSSVKANQSLASNKKTKKKADLKARSCVLESILESLLIHSVAMDAPPAVQQRLLNMVSDINHEVGFRAGSRVG